MKYKFTRRVKKLFRGNRQSTLYKQLNSALALYFSGKVDESQKVLSNVLKLNPSNITALILSAKCYARCKQAKSAVNQIEKVHLDVLPKKERLNIIDAYNIIAINLSEEEKFESAIKLLQRAIQLSTKNYESKLILANIFYLQQRFEEAVRLFSLCYKAKKIRDINYLNNFIKALESNDEFDYIKRIINFCQDNLTLKNYGAEELAVFWLNRQYFELAKEFFISALEEKNSDPRKRARLLICIYICDKELGKSSDKNSIKKELSDNLKKLSHKDRENTLVQIVETCKTYNQSSLAWLVIQGALPPKLTSKKLLFESATLARNYGNFNLAKEWVKTGLSIDKSDVKFAKLKLLIDGEINVAHHDYRPSVNWPPPSNWAPKENHILHVLETSLPSKNNDYGIRSHEMLKAQQKLNWVVTAVTRPGFPIDSSALSQSYSAVYDSVLYYRIKSDGEAHYFQRPLDKYLDAYAHRLLQICIRERPQILQAVSNFKNALAAKAVADCLNIPWAYEIRGLWEEGLVSNRIISPHSERFEYVRNLEDEALSSATVVTTTSRIMKTHLMDRSIPADKIFIVPHAVDAEYFKPMKKNVSLQKKLEINGEDFVFGFVGKLNRYEGLLILLDACKLLVEKNISKFKCLIIGRGKDLNRIKRTIRQLNLENNVRIVSDATQANIRNYYNLLNLAVIPRTADPICQIETPKNPFEAMSMELPLLVSGTKALREIVSDCTCGEFFEPENRKALAEKLESFMNNRELLKSYGKNARKWIIEERNFDKVVANYNNAYEYALNTALSEAA